LSPTESIDVICLSLEPWDEVWRRNQHLAQRLLALRSTLRILFVEPPVDVVWTLRRGRWPKRTGLRPVGESGRLWAVAPSKWLPRRVWPRGDRSLGRQVVAAGRRLHFDRPLLWVNDSTYAHLVGQTGWPCVYDVTDDWLLASGSPQEMRRQQDNDAQLLRDASEVVVCSPALVQTRSRDRTVHLIPNGVDIDHLRTPMPRPGDLPDGPVALYQGTVSAGRLDMDLCTELARALSGRASLVFVGPSTLGAEVGRGLTDAGALVLGSRPYSDLPAYLQHADVMVVPHQVSPFIQSLDPIKAREFIAVGRPVVATPVSGFQDQDPPIRVADREHFVDAVQSVLDRPGLAPGPGPLLGRPKTWTDLASEFLAVLDTAAAEGSRGGGSVRR
jgi:teichuronic acid biosynthesis glycosyltransferase TuaH